MSVNGITSANSSYTTPQTTTKTKASQTTNTADAKDIGVVYETSSKTDDKSNKIKDYSSVVATMKKELSTKNEQLQTLLPLNRHRKILLTMVTGVLNRRVIVSFPWLRH